MSIKWTGRFHKKETHITPNASPSEKDKQGGGSGKDLVGSPSPAYIPPPTIYNPDKRPHEGGGKDGKSR